MASAPSGKTLAIASIDGTVILWDLTDSALPQRLGQSLTGGEAAQVARVVGSA